MPVYENVFDPADHKMVFVCGLHRSGTSILHRIIAHSPEVSGFANTGVPEDEGQHLQNVFQPALAFGGPGKFAFHPEAALTESSALITEANRQQLLGQWAPYWDQSRPVLIEKSPPNLIRTRFLQALFPGAYFITIVRHPIAVSLATQKWSKTAPDNLLEHWLAAHRTYRKDREHLERELSLSYEGLVADPAAGFARISAFLDIAIAPDGERLENKNQRYFDQWEAGKWWELGKKRERQALVRQFEDQLQEFGYSLRVLTQHPAGL